MGLNEEMAHTHSQTRQTALEPVVGLTSNVRKSAFFTAGILRYLPLPVHASKHKTIYLHTTPHKNAQIFGDLSDS